MSGLGGLVLQEVARVTIRRETTFNKRDTGTVKTEANISRYVYRKQDRI